MKLNDGDERWIRMTLKAHGIKSTEGLKIALMPRDDKSIDLVLVPHRSVLTNYELEGNETITELASALQELLEGSDVRAPSV